MKYSLDYKNTLIKLESDVKNDIYELFLFLKDKLDCGVIDYNSYFKEVYYNCPDEFDLDIFINGKWYEPSSIILNNIRNGEYISVKIMAGGLEYSLTEVFQLVDLYDYLYHIYIDYINQNN